MKIHDEVKYLKQHYTDDSVQLYEGLEYKQRDLIKLADFYSLSRYMGGQKDDLGRDKPFFNTVNFRVTLAKTATEFDIKDFVATSDDTEMWVQTMFINRELYKWMKRTRFSRFLNEYAYTRPKYGGVLYKSYIDKDDELKVEVVNWRNVFTDQVDILGSPIIEEHHLTPLDFINKEDVWQNTDQAIEYFEEERKKNPDEAPTRLTVEEVTGVFTENTYLEAIGKEPTEDGDSKYSLQKHFMVRMEGKEKNDIILYSTKPKKLGYRYMEWEKVVGRGLGRGVIEESEEGQVWINDLAIKQKNVIDISGKVALVTDSNKYGGSVLEHDDGKIYQIEKGDMMQRLELAPSSLGMFDAVMQQWENQLDKANNTYDANTGEQPPSGTPYSQTALLNRVADRPFAFRREEAGIDLEELINEDVIPHLLKKIEGEHVLAEEFNEEELKTIDEAFGNKVGRKVAKDLLLQFQQFTQDDINELSQEAIDRQQKNGSKRTIKIPKGYFDGWEGRVTLNITNEQYDKANILTSLSQVMQTVTQSYDPNTGTFAILENPTLSKLFGTIIDTAGIGISPIELGIGKATAKPLMQQMPQQNQQIPQMGAEQPVQ